VRWKKTGTGYSNGKRRMQRKTDTSVVLEDMMGKRVEVPMVGDPESMACEYSEYVGVPCKVLNEQH